MHTFLHNKFKNNIFALLKQNRNTLLAVSGGQDSLCLTKLVCECFQNYNKHLEAVYIDHQWQKDSVKHIKHIINLTNQIKVKLSVYQIKDLYFSENLTRVLRYKILVRHAKKYGYNQIIVAHTQNDKIETFLHNLVRGTSIEGATSLTWTRQINKDISIIRPLLNFKRQEITWFCRQFHLPTWSDITNYNYNIRRNRLRHELIPYLKQYFNPNIEEALCSFLDISNKDNAYIKENVVKLYLISKHKRLISLNTNILKQQHIRLQERTLQLFFQYNFNKVINKITLKKIMAVINSRNLIKTTLYSKNLTIQNQNGWLYANFTTTI
uniref:tRNA(Ile)-lysidine synthase n=1 Tax=Rhodogorgon sp. TaxID=2485824 RepID=A0A3G3MI66_9FLOR|nr:tRNA(Ile)-lysidine synthase [Rhodogorgon sp.]